MATESSSPARRLSRFERLPGSMHAKENAAITIQKNYRGYRARRQLNGLGLDASTRWTEALKEVQYRNALRPLSRDRNPTPHDVHNSAMSNWRLVTEAARHAASDDNSDTGGEEGMSTDELKEYKAKKAAARKKMSESAKMMDLPYWLEMVDTKHRYGANLKPYHMEWQKSDTKENFFYWLDHGEGKSLELPTISRERLESMQVRYLSREERQQYLVRVDSEGRLCWAKNGERISTTTEFRDSVQGVVPVDSETPTWSSPTKTNLRGHRRNWSDASSMSSYESEASDEEEAEAYATPQFTHAKGVKKLKQVSPAVILNKLLLKTVKPNTWIFVADTSFHLYVGIKQSGSFQHSSFLQGARIASAGLIKIKDGQIRKLSPLSGHYRTPTKNFRLFMKSVKEAGVDTSRLSISRSYTVLLSLETYNRSRKAIRNGISHILHPQQYKHEQEMKRKSLDMKNTPPRTPTKSEHSMVLPDRTKQVSTDGTLTTESNATSVTAATTMNCPNVLVTHPTRDECPDHGLSVPDVISTGILVETRPGKTPDLNV